MCVYVSLTVVRPSATTIREREIRSVLPCDTLSHCSLRLENLEVSEDESLSSVLSLSGKQGKYIDAPIPSHVYKVVTEQKRTEPER